MRVLAFDPGYERLGVAVVEKIKKEELLYSNCLRTDTALPFPKRLRELGAAAEALIAEWKPTAVALENVYFEKNAKTAMGVAQVRGMLAYIAAARDLTVFEYTPLEVKAAITGYGKSDKRAVAAMLPHLVCLPPKARLDDEVDAVAVALTCLAMHKGAGFRE